MSLSNEVILNVENLRMYFSVTRGWMKKKVADVKAVDGVTFKLRKGETLGLVGESGCGKTTVGRCINRLYEPTAGQIVFNEQDITHLNHQDLQAVRSKISMIFQDPYSSLDPRQNSGSIVGEPLYIHKMVSTRAEHDEKVAKLFEIVGLDPLLMPRYPHEFSGGQRQRIGIARALACNPNLIICDEPVSALDVSIQAQIINLLQDLRDQHMTGLSYIFVAHDLSVVKHISDRIAVMYLGRIVEITTPEQLYDNPLHPYTKALLSAVPVPDPEVEATRERIILKGEVPSPMFPPTGCALHNRCNIAMPECKTTVPRLKDVGESHEVACLHYN